MSSVMTSSTTSSNNKVWALCDYEYHPTLRIPLLSVCQSVGQSDSLNHLYIIHKLLCFYLESQKAMILSLETSVVFWNVFTSIISTLLICPYILSINTLILKLLIYGIICLDLLLLLFVIIIVSRSHFLFFGAMQFYYPSHSNQWYIWFVLCVLFLFPQPPPPLTGSIFDSLCSAAIQHLMLGRPLWYIGYWCNHNNICYSIASMPVLLSIMMYSWLF